MNLLRLISIRASAALLITLCVPALSSAQYISLKSIPVAAGEQFMIFPSQNLGMAGVSIALDDPLLDPFVNPAKGVRVNGTRIFGTPTFYNITDDNGDAQTLPLGVLFGAKKWFGGVSLAVQQLGAPQPDNNFIWFGIRDDFVGSPIPPQTFRKDNNANNMYVSGLLGTELLDSGISIAAGVSWCDLDAVDGVSMLYANSLDIEQFGHNIDYRIGLFGELSGQRSFEVLLLHNRFNMTHDVSYPFWSFDEETNTTTSGIEVERNLDRTRTWGLHLGYVQPLSLHEWKIGGIFTINRKSHPKIPNYEIMNIPRDPGDSWAYNFGMGLSRQEGPATFGIDLIYEPIWSNTWAEAAEPVEARSGRIIAPGQKTVDNEFNFNNWLLRIGIGRQEELFGFQFGLQIRWIRYRLEQIDMVEEFWRTQKESWAEWTPSVGLSLSFPEFQIRYTGRLTTGTGMPGVIRNNWNTPDDLRAGDIIVAPSGPLTLQEAKVYTHQISVSVPLRR